MTVASLTVASPAPTGGQPTVGRNIFVEGNRYIGLFTVTIKDLYETGGGSLNFDPQKYGFPGRPVLVQFSYHLTIANVALMRYVPNYDFVNKKIIIFDQTDHDEPNTDDLTGLVLDVRVVGE